MYSEGSGTAHQCNPTPSNPNLRAKLGLGSWVALVFVLCQNTSLYMWVSFRVGRARTLTPSKPAAQGPPKEPLPVCPPKEVNTLATDDEGVELSPLRCYAKDAKARTILAVSKKPTHLHPNGGALSAPTDKIVWEWRGKKCHTICNNASKYKLQEVQEIAEQHKISTLSTRKRVQVLPELRYTRTAEEWKRAHSRREEKKQKKRAWEAEIATLRKFTEAKEKIEAKTGRLMQPSLKSCGTGNRGGRRMAKWLGHWISMRWPRIQIPLWPLAGVVLGKCLVQLLGHPCK